MGTFCTASQSHTHCPLLPTKALGLAPDDTFAAEMLALAVEEDVGAFMDSLEA